MQGFGPYAVTAGTIQPVAVDPGTGSLYIANDTPYDVFVSFNPTQPSPSGILNADWIGVVQAFHHVVRPIPGGVQLQTPQGAMTFQGKVWLLPVNTRNTNLALNGTISTTANLYVEAYLPGEEPPIAYASPRQTDVTSQARTIAVPVTPRNCNSNNTGTMGVGTFFNIGSVNISASPLTQTIGYLYFINSNSSGAAAWAAWRISFVTLDNSLTVLQTNNAHQWITVGNIGTTPGQGEHNFSPPTPLSVFFITPANTAFINVQLALLASASSTATSCYYTVGWGFDQRNNGFTVPDIGSGLQGYTTGNIY